MQRIADEDKVVIEYQSLSDKVYEYLCNQIIEGKITYGEKLSLKRISEQLKVSTMPVRDALKKLEMENVVQINPRSHCIVKVPTKKSILDAFEMRRLLELRVVEMIHGGVTERELAPLSKIVTEMCNIVGSNVKSRSLRRYIHLDQLFHTTLCGLSENEYLQKFYREVSLHLNMTFTYRIGIPANISGTYREHKRIVEHLSSKSTEALAVLKKHLNSSKNNIVKGDIFKSLH
jgi:DNA-binding GntR family transcriptional regulator